MDGVARVDRQIDDHLFQLLRIGAHRAQIAVVPHGEGDLFAHQPFEQLADFADDIGQLHDFGAQGLLPAECQQLPRQAGGAVGIGADLLDVVVIAVARRMAQQHQVAIPDDRGQHIVEIMRDAARQLSHRLHLRGLRDLRVSGAFLRSNRPGTAAPPPRPARAPRPGPATPARPADPVRRMAMSPLVAGPLRVAAHGIGQRALVFAHGQVRWILRQRGILPPDRAQERLVAEQETPVAVRHAQGPAAARPATLPAAACPHPPPDRRRPMPTPLSSSSISDGA